jgi:hypothetical protein
MMVRTAVKFGVLILGLLIGAGPIMACMLPDAEMTAAEKACCREMAGDCGKDMQTSSHSCCKTVVSKENPALLVSSHKAQHPTFVFVEIPASPQIGAHQSRELAHPERSHSPPLFPLSSIQILRI